MKDYKVPIQCLIDHIKTAHDIDPWAKDMAEELLKEQEPVVHCRECKWYERCELNDYMLNHENGFCADGERKERNG